MSLPLRPRQAALLFHAVLSIALGFGLPLAPALAQGSSTSPNVLRYEIEAGSLEATLMRIARQSGRTVSYTPELVRGKNAAAVSGDFTPEQAMRLALGGSGLELSALPDGTLTLVPEAPRPQSAVLMQAVKVEDTMVSIVASENSGSYTAKATTIGKTVQSLRETPQSISVITRERLDDQNVSSLPEALKYVTGVTVIRYDGAGYFNTFNARGYAADTVQLDGINVQYNANMADTDLAVYDRVEIQRGAAGLFQGAGEPGILVNLSRKRALAETQVKGLFSGGSWDSYRAEADVTGSLNESGSLRGRALLVWDDRDSYMDGMYGKKKLGYGTLEYDLQPNTTLSIGAIVQRIDSVVNQGLPAYADGSLADLPRSTAVIAGWNDLDMDTEDYFAELEHRFDRGGLAKLSVRHLDRSRLYAGARANSALDPSTGDFSIANVYYYTRLDDTAADLYLSQPFEFGGREHDFVAGADYRTSESGTPLKYNLGYNPAAGIANIDDYDQNTPEPELVYGAGYGATRADTEQYGGYARVRLRATDALSALVGARLTWWESKNIDLATGGVSGKYDSEGEVTPYGALMLDLTKTLSVYTSYAVIFKPQNSQKSDRSFIKPRSGEQYEAGLKGEFFDGRVNAHAAIYRLQDENRALSDPADDNFYVAAGKVRSDGFETEVSGELLRHWQLSTGYAYAKTEFLRAADGQQGTSFAPLTPKHSFNLWTKYSFADGLLDGVDVGGGVRSVSRFYSPSGTTRFEASGYTVLSLQAGYRINPKLSLAANADNVLDKKYYEKVSSAGRQNFYGAPRSLMLTLRAQW